MPTLLSTSRKSGDKNLYKMKINLLIVATGKYKTYLIDLLQSVEKYFMLGQELHCCIFSDTLYYEWMNAIKYVANVDFTFYYTEHKPWPHATLKRFHFFLQHRDQLPGADYLFYIDADTIFKQPIGDEILSKRTAVQHCGYVDGQNLPFETNPKSMAYVPESKSGAYYGGGFWGFESVEFWNVAHYCAQAIDFDEGNGIIPVWHDESILNKYLAACQPTLVLDPSYHHPENNPHIYAKWAAAGKSYDCKILLLDKKHKEVRQ